MENIKENIKSLQSKEAEIERLTKEIADKRKDFEKYIEGEIKKFEKSLEPLKESSNRISEEFNLLASNKVCVSLDDLITELSSLTGICVSNMGIEINTNVGYWGIHNLREIHEFINSTNYHPRSNGNRDGYNFWEIILKSEKGSNPFHDKQEFVYRMRFKLNLEELQSDGKSLLKHCRAAVGYSYFQGYHYTDLVIDKNIGSLNCNLSLNDIVKGEIINGPDKVWYPTDLLTQAIINCVERQNDQKNQKSSPIFKVKGLIKKLTPPKHQ